MFTSLKSNAASQPVSGRQVHPRQEVFYTQEVFYSIEKDCPQPAISFLITECVQSLFISIILFVLLCPSERGCSRSGLQSSSRRTAQ